MIDQSFFARCRRGLAGLATALGLISGPSHEHGITVRGFSRIKIVNSDGTIAGDSGEVPLENKVMNYCCQSLSLLIAGSTAPAVGFMALGTATNTYAAGTALGTVTNLVGELAFAGTASTQVGRFAVAAATGTYQTAGTTAVGVQFTATFTSGANFVNSATTVTINNCGLFASSSAGTCFCNNTFATSQLTSAQNVQATWTLLMSN